MTKRAEGGSVSILTLKSSGLIWPKEKISRLRMESQILQTPHSSSRCVHICARCTQGTPMLARPSDSPAATRGKTCSHTNGGAASLRDAGSIRSSRRRGCAPAASAGAGSAHVPSARLRGQSPPSPSAKTCPCGEPAPPMPRPARHPAAVPPALASGTQPIRRESVFHAPPRDHPLETTIIRRR